jgi:hypothetical protein
VRFNAEGDAELGLLGIPRPMIVLRRSEERSGPDRQVFDIIGGMLLRKGRAYEARFELREVLGGTALIAAIHDYAPALPWRIYQSSQAWAHLWVMRAFSRHLARLLTAGSDASDPASAQGAASH